MQRGEGHAQARTPLGHRRRPDRGDQETASLQRRRHRGRGGFVAAEHRLDRSARRHQLQAEAAGARAELADQLLQPRPAPVVAAGEPQRGQRRGGQGRRQRGGVEVGPGRAGQVLDQVRVAGDHCAIAAQRLAERDQLQGHVGHAQAGLGRGAAALRAQHADAVGVIDVQQRVLGPRDQRQRAQRRDVAVHAEDAIGRQHRRAARRVAQLAHRPFRVQVRVAAQARAGQAGGVDQAGVVEPVLDADIVVLQQRLLHRQVGGEAAAEQQRARHAEPFGHLALELRMQGVVAADQVRGGRAGAFARDRVLQGGADFELRSQAQVVVAAEAGQPLAIDLDPHPVAPGHRAPLAQAPLRDALAALGEDAFVDVGTGHRCPSPRRALRGVVRPRVRRRATARGCRHAR